MISHSHASERQYALTIYSSAQPGTLDATTMSAGGLPARGYAQIVERRQIELASGVQSIRYSDVAGRIDPTTVSFKSLTDLTGTRVLEQNFEFDLVSLDKLKARYVGEQVTAQYTLGDSAVEVSGRLLSSVGQSLLIEQAGGAVTAINNPANLRFTALPGGLITRPTLSWSLNAKRAGRHDIEVGYQTQGMAWWADYIGTLSADGCKLDLQSWVTLVNQSGASYPAAKLKLVAGEPNRVQPAAQPPGMVMAARLAESSMDAGFEESELFEYHLYTLGRPTDVPDNSSKQIELFAVARNVPCKRELIVGAFNQGFWTPTSAATDQGFAATLQLSARAYLSFDNREGGGLGVPLPAGRVRVNTVGADGMAEFVGEDKIKHTPRNETITLFLGEAFDVVADRKQADFNYDSVTRTITESFEVEIRNRKRTAADLVLRERLGRWSGWTVSNASVPYVKRDAYTIDFALNLDADSVQTVRYTVVYRW